MLAATPDSSDSIRWGAVFVGWVVAEVVGFIVGFVTGFLFGQGTINAGTYAFILTYVGGAVS